LTPAIEITDVTRSFGLARAIDGVSLTVMPGEIISLIGQSGCGKSSLLRIISGVDAGHGGTVSMFGKMVSGGGEFVEPELRSAGYMLQDYALFPHLTTKQNMHFGLRKLPAAAAADRVARMVRRLDLEPLLAKYPHMLSGGEQQRVALARALLPEPRVLLMDEPFSNLDRRLAESIRTQTLAILREHNTTAILVTHDPEEALACSDRIALMRAGRFEQVGTSYELYYRPKSRYSADYFCAYNKIAGVFRGGKIETVLGSFAPATDAPEGEATTVYIRPQSVGVSRDGLGLPGRIVARSFLGDAERLTILMDAAPLQIVAHLPVLLPDGDDHVQVALPSIGMLHFPG
jgi:iron(III) transport system ATP-binding protein